MDRKRENALVVAENRGGSVAVVHIGIDDHRFANRAIGLHAANRDSDIVDRAEAFAMIRMRVMEAATDIAAESVAQRRLRRKNRSAGGEPDSFGAVPANTALPASLPRTESAFRS